VATELNNLAALYRVQGQYAKAEPLFQRALAIDQKALGPEHPVVAMDLNNQAELYRVQGQCAKAEPLYQQALGVLEKALPPGHPDLATVLENYANCLAKLDRGDESKRLTIQAAEMRSRHSATNMQTR
jgi:tetratricopeptide (TPR) repeat protein